MKKYFVFFVASILLFASTFSSAQNVSISDGNTLPDPSAMLEVKSLTKGMLFPRMNTLQRTSIPSPAFGLIVFDNETNSFWYYRIGGWHELPSVSSIINYWTSVDSAIYNNNKGNVGIGTNLPLSKFHVKGNSEVVRIEGTTPYIGFYNNAAIYKGFVWQGPSDNMSMGTAVGNTSGRVEFYNNGKLNLYLASTGNAELSGTSPGLNFNRSGIRAGEIKTSGNNLEISARKLQSSTPGNLLLQLNELSGFGNFYAGNVGIGTDNPSSKLTVDGGTGNALEIKGGIKVSGNKAVFVLVCDSANLIDSYRPPINYNPSVNYYTAVIIDNSLCNGDPNAMILISQVLNQYGGNDIVPCAVWYNTSMAKWNIRINRKTVQETTCYGAADPFLNSCQNGMWITVMPYLPARLEPGDKFNVMIVKQ